MAQVSHWLLVSLDFLSLLVTGIYRRSWNLRYGDLISGILEILKLMGESAYRQLPKSYTKS